MKNLTDYLKESLLDADYSPSDCDIIEQFIHEYCALQPEKLTGDRELRNRQIQWAERFMGAVKSTFKEINKADAKKSWKTSAFIVVKTYGSDDMQFTIIQPTRIQNNKWRFMRGIRLGFIPACIQDHDFNSMMSTRDCELNGIYLIPIELAVDLSLICTEELPR